MVQLFRVGHHTKGDNMKGYENTVTVACVNFSPITGNKAATLEKIKRFTLQASKKGANIIVFPETALTGYTFPVEMTSGLAETIPGPSTEEMAKLAAQHDVYVIFGLVERDKKHPEIQKYYYFVIIFDYVYSLCTRQICNSKAHSCHHYPCDLFAVPFPIKAVPIQ